MRLWHQSRTELGRLPAYQQAMEDHFRRVAEPGTTVDLHGLQPGTYVSDYPPADTQYPFFGYLHSIQVLQNARRAEAEGYDAYVIMNLPETVQQEAQSLVDIPVVSYAQASMYAAAMLGRRFAIFTMIPAFVPLYEQHITRYGMSSRAWGVAQLGLTAPDIFGSFEDPTALVEQLTNRVQALQAEGVDVVIPGEAPVSASLARAGIGRVGEVPIVDAIGVTIKFAEAFVRLQQATGMRASRATYFGARPPEGRLAELDAFYGLNELGGGRAPSSET